LTEAGVGIVFVSSELTELLGVCDRILVVHEGRITGEFNRTDATEEKIMRAAAGMGNEM
jgi:ribose transport system ATP-binding protein